MANSNPIDTIIRFLVKYQGSADIKKLVQDTLELDSASEATQKELARLTGELQKTAGAQAALDAFKKLKAEFLDYQKNIRATQETIKQLDVVEKEQGTRLLEVKTALEAARKELASFKDGSMAYLGTSKQVAAAKADVKNKVRELAAEYKTATREYNNTTKELDVQRTSVEKLSAEQDKLRPKISKVKDELKDSGVILNNVTSAQAQLTNTTKILTQSVDRLAQSTKAVGDDQRKFALRSDDASQRLLRLKAANDSAAQALAAYRRRTEEATKGTDQLSNSVSSASSTLSSLKGILMSLIGFLTLRSAVEGAKNILMVGDAAERAKIQLAALYKSSADGNAAFAKLQTMARANSLNFQSLLESAQKLKVLGLEPMDGTLQAIIDQNARLGGSSEVLNRIILALGQAWTKTRLQAEEMRQLVEAGVPAFDLLTKATGKSAQELLKLSEQGRLGRDVIRKLINEMGESTKGAGAQNAKLLSGLIAGLQDRWVRFAQAVSNSGALDFAKKQLTALRDYIDQLDRNGKLKQYAQSISDTMVSVGTVIKNTAVFINDHSAAIGQLLRSYLLFKGTQIVGNLLAGAAAFLKTSDAVKTATGAVGKLGGSITAVTGLISKIPLVRAITIAVVGYDLAVRGITAVSEALADNSEAAENLRQKQAARAKQVEAEAQTLGKLRAQLSQYKDEQILTAAEVARLSEAERAGYLARLQGLQQYLIAKNSELLRLREMGQATEEEQVAIQNQLVKTRQAMVDFSTGTSQALLAAKLGISAGAVDIINNFKTIAGNAEQVGVRLEETFRNFNEIPDTKLGDIALGLSVVSDQSEKASRVIQNGLMKQLSDLNGDQLLRFQSQAIAAFNTAANGSQRAAKILDTTLLVAMEKLGVAPQKFQMGMQEAGRQTTAVFTAIIENARATAAQIEIAFKAAISGAVSIEEVTALKQRLQIAFDQGKISADGFARAVGASNDQIRKLKEALNPLADEFEKLGIKSQQSLINTRDSAREAFDAIVVSARKGGAAQEDVRRAFLAYGQAVLESIKDSKSWEQAVAKSQLSVLASTHGLTDAMEELGIQSQSTMNAIMAASIEASRGLDGAAASARGAAAGMGNLAGGTSSASQNLNELKTSADGAGFALGDLSNKGLDALSMMGRLDRTSFNLLQEQTLRAQEELKQLKDLTAAYDPLEREVSSLRAQYTMLGDETLRALASEKLRADQLRQSAQEQKNQLNQGGGATASTPNRPNVTQPVSRGGAPIRIIVESQGNTAIGKDNANQVAQALMQQLMSELQRGRTISGG